MKKGLALLWRFDCISLCVRAYFYALSAYSDFAAETLFGAFTRCLAAFDRIKEMIAVQPDFPQFARNRASGASIRTHHAIAAF